MNNLKFDNYHTVNIKADADKILLTFFPILIEIICIANINFLLTKQNIMC